jgi:hypothetical protein
MSIACDRNSASTDRQSSSDNFPICKSNSASRISRYFASFAASNAARRSSSRLSISGPRRNGPSTTQATTSASTTMPSASSNAGARYARESSRPRRAAYRLVTRRRRASGEGQIAVRAPATASAPPIQIHATNGDTISLNVAGGGLFR